MERSNVRLELSIYDDILIEATQKICVLVDVFQPDKITGFITAQSVEFEMTKGGIEISFNGEAKGDTFELSVMDGKRPIEWLDWNPLKDGKFNAAQFRLSLIRINQNA